MPSTSQDKHFAVSVSRHPALELIGMKIRTIMQSCQEDCPRLWHEAFAPWIQELHPEGNCPSWGASTAFDAATGSFDYWALLKAPQHVPNALTTFTLPAGLYAQCALTSIAEIHTAYHYLYSRWLPSQSTYIGLEDGVCFEYYPPDFCQAGHMNIYIPVTMR